MERNKQSSLIIFAASTDIRSVIQAMQSCKSRNIFVLTTNKLFPYEEAVLRSQGNFSVVFHTFAEYLSDKKMAEIDQTAYEKQKDKTLVDYYVCITRLVNEVVADQFHKKYVIRESFVLDDRFGITPSVWKAKTVNCFIYSFNKPSSTHSLYKMHRLFSSYFNNLYLLSKFQLLRINGSMYIFLGNVQRIKKVINSSAVEILPWGVKNHVFQVYFLFSFFIRFLRNYGESKKNFRSCFAQEWIRKITKYNGAVGVLTTIHEYSKIPLHIKTSLGESSITILQDGYLPKNYSSRYLQYMSEAKEFWVWNRLSLQLFQNNSLPARVSNFYRVLSLPEVKSIKKIEHILIATSSAGDWTALKNRSDDDLLALAFLEVANTFPHITFTFRAHPFMSMEQLHGDKAYKRLNTLFSMAKASNISLSKKLEKSTDSTELYVSQNSYSDDLAVADMVFGEHSFSMIEAGKAGKIWASVNVTGRRNLFQSYTDIGFLHCRNVNEITTLITNCLHNSEEVIAQYNLAVRKYNTNGS